jgi:hypothetical protein
MHGGLQFERKEDMHGGLHFERKEEMHGGFHFERKEDLHISLMTDIQDSASMSHLLSFKVIIFLPIFKYLHQNH